MVSMQRIPTKDRRRRTRAAIVLIACSVAVLAWTLPALAASGPPSVPACYSQTGACGGIFIKAAVGVVKRTSGQHGVFTLTSPAPLQFTAPVSCGDAGCLYNHLNWTVGGNASVVSGCDANDSVCKVKVAPGGAWSPVLANQNDYPVTPVFLLWTPPRGNHEISGTVSVGCEGATTCGPRVPLANATIDVRGNQTFSTTTDGSGKYSASVPKGSYIMSPGLGGGYRYTPSRHSVRVTDSDVKNVDFTACAASSVVIPARVASAASAGKMVTLHGKSCFNGVAVRYVLGSRTMLVSWRFLPLCSTLSQTPVVDKAVPPAAPLTTVLIPRGARDAVTPTKDGATAAIFGTDGEPMLTIAITHGGKAATVVTSGLSNDVKSRPENNLTGAGGLEDCAPKAETLSLT
jgi:hypothetical protein